MTSGCPSCFFQWGIGRQQTYILYIENNTYPFPYHSQYQLQHQPEGWYWSRADTSCDMETSIYYYIYYILSNKKKTINLNKLVLHIIWKKSVHVHVFNKNMSSNCFNKHVATEQKFPQVLKVDCFKWLRAFQLHLKMSTVTNVLFFVCKHAQIPKRKKVKEFRMGCDTDPYQPWRADNLYRPIRLLWCHLYHMCKKPVFITNLHQKRNWENRIYHTP